MYEEFSINFKKTIVSLMAAGAVMAGGLAGVAAQDVTPGPVGQELTVTVENDGVFAVQFCGAEGAGLFDKVVLTSQTSQEDDRTRTTDTVICYTDNKASRGGYVAMLSADDFRSEDGNVISADNLSLGTISIMNSGQWGDHVGGIAALDGDGKSIQRPNTPVEWGGDSFGDGPLHVHNIWPGAGTAGTKYQGELDKNGDQLYPDDVRSDAGSWQEVELELIVPVDTVGDTYSTTLTLTVTPAGAD